MYAYFLLLGLPLLFLPFSILKKNYIQWTLNAESQYPRRLRAVHQISQYLVHMDVT
jgi:hypothetical protein